MKSRPSRKCWTLRALTLQKLSAEGGISATKPGRAKRSWKRRGGARKAPGPAQPTS